jgi:hypothetical protein
MRFLKWSLAVSVVIVVIGFALPDEVVTTRAMIIEAEPPAIHSHLAELKTWPEWSIWNSRTDPTAKFTFAGAASGTGAIWTWQGERFEGGRLEVVDSDPQKGIRYRVTISGFVVDGEIALHATGDGTLVRWTDRTAFGLGPIGGWMRLFLTGMVDREIGNNMETSLRGLKKRVEAGGAQRRRVTFQRPVCGVARSLDQASKVPSMPSPLFLPTKVVLIVAPVSGSS